MPIPRFFHKGSFNSCDKQSKLPTQAADRGSLRRLPRVRAKHQNTTSKSSIEDLESLFSKALQPKAQSHFFCFPPRPPKALRCSDLSSDRKVSPGLFGRLVRRCLQVHGACGGFLQALWRRGAARVGSVAARLGLKGKRPATQQETPGMPECPKFSQVYLPKGQVRSICLSQGAQRASNWMLYTLQNWLVRNNNGTLLGATIILQWGSPRRWGSPRLEVSTILPPSPPSCQPLKATFREGP